MARIGGYAAGAAEPMFRIVAKGEVELDAEVIETRIATVRTARPRASKSPALGTIAGTVRLGVAGGRQVDAARTRAHLPRRQSGSARRLVRPRQHRDRHAAAAWPCRLLPSSTGPMAPPCRSCATSGSRRARSRRASPPARWSKCAKGSRMATWWWRAPARSCATAMRCARHGRARQAERGTVDELEHLGLVDPPAGSVARAVHGADDARLRQLRRSCRSRASPTSTCRSCRSRVYQSGAAPSELEVQVTKKIEDAIAGVNGVKHQTSAVTEGSSVTTIEFRLEVNQDRALNDVKDADRAHSRRAAAHHRRADRHARRDRGPADRDLRARAAPGMTPEELSWFVDDVVMRALQGVKGVLADRALRRRRPRDPRRARSRPTARLRHHRRRREPPAPGDQRRSGRRPRRYRRPRAGDPHAGRQADHGGSRRDRDRAAAAAARCASTSSAPSRMRSPSRAPSPPSTARRWWRSPSRAPRARATRWSRPTWPRRSPSCRRPIPTSS